MLTWMMNSQPEPCELIRCNRPETFCHVCNVDTGEVTDHLETEAHINAVTLTDKYLTFVQSKKLNPVQCSKEEIKEMLDTLPQTEVDAVLNAIDKIHDAIDEQVSILRTFYKQLLRPQIPKAQKNAVKPSVFFALFGSARLKAERQMLVKSTNRRLAKTHSSIKRLRLKGELLHPASQLLPG